MDPELAGLAEAIRCSGIGSGSLLVTSANRSHRIAGVIDGYAVVVNLPGSETGLEVFIPLLDHVLDQLSGGDRA